MFAAALKMIMLCWATDLDTAQYLLEQTTIPPDNSDASHSVL
jgi:hypothetical protein